MTVLQSIGKWFKDNWAWLLIMVFLAATFVSDYFIIKNRSRNSEEIVACETLCFPQQSEYLRQGDANACWCYIDSETIKKSQ